MYFPFLALQLSEVHVINFSLPKRTLKLDDFIHLFFVNAGVSLLINKQLISLSEKKKIWLICQLCDAPWISFPFGKYYFQSLTKFYSQYIISYSWTALKLTRMNWKLATSGISFYVFIWSLMGIVQLWDKISGYV